MVQSVEGAVFDKRVSDVGGVEHCGRCASDESVLGHESAFCHGVRSVLTPECAAAMSGDGYPPLEAGKHFTVLDVAAVVIKYGRGDHCNPPRIGDCVDLDDLALRDGEPHDGERSSMHGDHDSSRSVDQRRM